MTSTRRILSTMSLAAWCVATMISGCDTTPDPLVGRWEILGAASTLQFLADGRLVAVVDGEQSFGSYELVQAGDLLGQVLLTIDRDTVLADYSVLGDTLSVFPVGQAEAIVAVRR